MLFFNILFGIDGLAAIVIFYFFFTGLADKTVSARNGMLWLRLTGTIPAVLLVSYLLHPVYPVLSTGLLLLPAIPVIGYLAFIIISMFWRGRWN